MPLSDIKTCRIFPGIGIARIGDSPHAYFIGPELPGQGPASDTRFKDSSGRIARQGARFRIFGYNDQGQVVRELTANDPDIRIEWTLSLANKKASNIAFKGVKHGLAMDKDPDPSQFRNLGVKDRSSLEITPSPRSISGCSQGGEQYAFGDGQFLGEAVFLGELRTDSSGRLIVLGGHGKSESKKGSRPIHNYANNDGWHDDVSDGPVTARVQIGGLEIPVVSSAWVIVAPPKFAPYVRNVVSLYDVMAEVAKAPVSARPSFTWEIYPQIRAFADQQWVNATSLRGHGPQQAGNFLDPDILKRLADNSAATSAIRLKMLSRLRDPNLHSVEQATYNFMPLLSGDEGDAIVGDPDKWLYLPISIYEMLTKWAKGDFESDWTGPPVPIVSLDDLPIQARPAALDKASLEFCVGGPFFPGIEITYIARDPTHYSGPFRFDRATLKPGDITRRMAVPWQADFYECQIHWWPAQRPDDVLTEHTYRRALKEFPAEARDGVLSQVLTARVRWDRQVGAHWINSETSVPAGQAPAAVGDNGMVYDWKSLGFVVPEKTDAGEVLQIEVGRAPYDGLDDRSYFYYLLNIDSYPDFVPKAEELARFYLDKASILIVDSKGSAIPEDYKFFPYTKEALDQRLDQIYQSLESGITDDPIADPGNFILSKEDLVERIRQFAPLNQLDGAWLRNVAQAGPIDEVGSLLFGVWMDEVGDGDPEQNHCNVYTSLMNSVGIELPPINTADYAFDRRFLDSAFTVPTFELAISQFTETFFPEIIGMTLWLEWEVLGLWPTVKIFEHYQVDPHFYKLHIGIDNAANGHGAKAKAAVHRFLDEARRRGGDAEVQALFKRIWTGYVAFATSSTLGDDLKQLLKERRDNTRTPADDIDDIMAQKKAYGSRNHGQQSLAGELINDLFDDPEAFRDALVGAKYIIPGRPGESRFFELTSFAGPMYKVFTENELHKFELWTFWLGTKQKPAPIETDVAKLMAACIANFKVDQLSARPHQTVKLVGPDVDHPGQKISHTVAEWFQGPVEAFMATLADPENKYIVSGKSSQSLFVTQILDGTNDMAFDLEEKADIAGGKTWHQVVIDWIDAGCPIPGAQLAQKMEALYAVSPKTLSTIGQRSTRAIGSVTGMGVVH